MCKHTRVDPDLLVTKDECDAGGALEATCSDCATAVCDFDAFCCDVEWDEQCVEEAADEAACSC